MTSTTTIQWIRAISWPSTRRNSPPLAIRSASWLLGELLNSKRADNLFHKIFMFIFSSSWTSAPVPAYIFIEEFMSGYMHMGRKRKCKKSIRQKLCEFTYHRKGLHRKLICLKKSMDEVYRTLNPGCWSPGRIQERWIECYIWQRKILRSRQNAVRFLTLSCSMPYGAENAPWWNHLSKR